MQGLDRPLKAPGQAGTKHFPRVTLAGIPHSIPLGANSSRALNPCVYVGPSSVFNSAPWAG